MGGLQLKISPRHELILRYSALVPCDKSNLILATLTNDKPQRKYSNACNCRVPYYGGTA